MVDQETWREALAALDRAAQRFGGVWAERRWMNTPGPVYTADADFALMGPTDVPEPIALDDEGIDVVFRQPCTLAEATRVIEAGRIDLLGGDACDGNRFWTPDGVREWWARRGERLRHITENLMNDSLETDEWPSAGKSAGQGSLEPCPARLEGPSWSRSGSKAF